MTLKVEHFDKLTGIASWSGPLADRPASGGTAGSKFFCTDVGGRVDTWDGSAWVKPITGGDYPAPLDARMFTINASTDCFADAADPQEAELLTSTYDGTKQHCRITYHHEAGAIPFASAVVVAINSANDAEAVINLTWDDKGAASTAITGEGMRMCSAVSPVCEYDFTGTSTYIDRIDLGGYLSAGTGAGDVYIMVEVW